MIISKSLLKYFILLVFINLYSFTYAQTAQSFLNEGKKLLGMNIEFYAQAIEKFDAAIALNNQLEEAYYYRGQSYFELGIYLKALKDFDKAIALQPDNSKTYQYRGKVKYYLKNYQDALWDLNKAIKLASNEDEYYLDRAKIHHKLYRYKKALVDCDKAIEKSSSFNHAIALSTRGWIKMEEGKYDEAYIDLQKAVREAPNRAIVRIKMGDYYLKTGKMEKALAEYSAVEKLNSNKSNRKNAPAFCNRALVRLSYGTNEAALKDARKAIQIDRHYFESFAVRAIANHNIGDFKAYQMDIDVYTNRKIDDHDYAFLVENIINYAKDGVIWKDAERWAESVAQKNPNYKNHLLYAKVLYKLNKSTSAGSVLEKSLAWAKREGKNQKEALDLLNKIKDNNADKTPPILRIISPAPSMLASARGIIVVEKASSITVIGTTQDVSGISKVLINGNEAEVKPNGDFTGTTNLSSSRDTKIQVLAYDKRGNFTEKMLLVRKEQAQNPNSNIPNRPILSSNVLGKHYALIFATDKYDFWGDLTNPIFDAKAIGKNLEDDYGYEVEYVLNPTKEEMMLKIREYMKKKYDIADQLFIFVAGHGDFDEDVKQGFIITKDSYLNDVTGSTRISHINLRDLVNKIPCKHLLLSMDVCFGGTFDPVIARRGKESDLSKDQLEYIRRKKRYTSRHYLTSGGKEYVPDGAPGQHSPFARKFLEALRKLGGSDGILTIEEITNEASGIEPKPRHGVFGDNEPGSDFLFIYRH